MRVLSSETRLPVKSWCGTLEPQARAQALNLANHPATCFHVALMPDCHVGYGMPIGGVIATRYHEAAADLNARMGVKLPDADLAFLPADHRLAEEYLRDMAFALAYALENRRRMLAVCRELLQELAPGVAFAREVDIHHNYAALETHFGREVFIGRKDG